MFEETWTRDFVAGESITSGDYFGQHMRNENDCLIDEKLRPLLMGDFFQDLDKTIYRVVISGGGRPVWEGVYKKSVFVSSCLGMKVPEKILEILEEEQFESSPRRTI